MKTLSLDLGTLWGKISDQLEIPSEEMAAIFSLQGLLFRHCYFNIANIADY
jgi:hypothetical protein